MKLAAVIIASLGLSAGLTSLGVVHPAAQVGPSIAAAQHKDEPHYMTRYRKAENRASARYRAKRVARRHLMSARAIARRTASQFVGVNMNAVSCKRTTRFKRRGVVKYQCNARNTRPAADGSFKTATVRTTVWGRSGKNKVARIYTQTSAISSN